MAVRVTTTLLFRCGVRPLIGREFPGSFQLVAVGARFGSSSTAHAVRSQHNPCLLASYVAGYSSRPCVLGAIKLLPAASVPKCGSQAVWSIQAVRGGGQYGASLLYVPASSAIYWPCQCIQSFDVKCCLFCHTDGIVWCH
jgi:hypothetical protein